jgi:hypothetical protein
MTQSISLDFLVETIAKALCFEKYVALAKIEDLEELDLYDVLEYYEKHQDIYLSKAQALLVMVNGSEEFLETVH